MQVRVAEQGLHRILATGVGRVALRRWSRFADLHAADAAMAILEHAARQGVGIGALGAGA